MNRLRFSLLWLIITAWLCYGGDAAFAQTDEDFIKQDKVELLRQVSAFVKSSNAKANEATRIIGVLGKDPFDGVNSKGQSVNHLDEMAREYNVEAAKENRRRIVIQRFASAEMYRRCHLLFVSSRSATNDAADTPEARLAAALKIAKDNKMNDPVLVVSDTSGFAQQGAPLNFYLEVAGNGSIGVRTELNPDAAKQIGFDMINPQYIERIRGGKGRIVK